MSFQLYSARNFGPWHAVLATLAGLGHTQVEEYGDVYSDARRMRGLLDRNDPTMPSGHFFPSDAFETGFECTMETAGVLGTTRLICPALPPSERSGERGHWQAVVRRLAQMTHRVRGAVARQLSQFLRAAR